MAKNDMFRIKVNPDSHQEGFQFEIKTNDLSQLDFNKTSAKSFHLLQNQKSVTAEIVNRDFDNRSYTLNIGGTNYEVSIYNKLDMLISEMGLTAVSQKVVNTIAAPMPGQIVKVDAKVGQEVKENDPILVLEAMKMENVMLAPRDGIIKEVLISGGDIVDKGQIMIGLEEEVHK